ncbi:siroheme decarboxylase subunit beta [Pseudomonas fluvialis]|uniref:siroheme decarboxylase subunit beta n=1 Tax=Pseudomonas fluvialis TaxID=1793966 RepID=UPI00370B9373
MSPSLDTAQQLHLRSLLEVGLPLHSQPFAVLGERIGATQQQVLEQVQDWQAQGLFRRFGLVLKHRALGFRANAMLVLDIPDALVERVGEQLGQTAGINLCYQRPRRLPHWPYNLFCMVHGRERAQVEARIAAILAAHGLQDYPHRLLFSSKAYKQCGGRYAPQQPERACG